MFRLTSTLVALPIFALLLLCRAPARTCPPECGPARLATGSTAYRRTAPQWQSAKEIAASDVAPSGDSAKPNNAAVKGASSWSSSLLVVRRIQRRRLPLDLGRALNET